MAKTGLAVDRVVVFPRLMNGMPERLLSADEVASFLGVKRDTVYKLIDRNGLPGIKVGRLWKFRQEQVDLWVDQQQPGPQRRTSNARQASGGETRSPAEGQSR